jgi:hypothetical protein
MARFNRVLNVLDLAASLLLPDSVYPWWPSRPSEERRLRFVAWALVAGCIAVLALGAWIAGLIPPGPACTRNVVSGTTVSPPFAHACRHTPPAKRP